MGDIDRLAALLVTDDPRQAADKTLAYLVSYLRARAGAVLTLDSEEPSLFIGQSLRLETLSALRALWVAHQPALLAGQLVSEGSHALIPIQHSRELVALLYLDAPRPFEPESIAVFQVALAEAVRANFRRPPFEAYLGSTRSEDLQRQHLLVTLSQNDWNIARAARLMGVTRRTVYLRLQRYGIPRKRVTRDLRVRETNA
ncbi:MAG TPA: helix-turn-helix domain-containing protein [Vicinamibacteria bacterium]|nr:helix-turn-helix domain-containing protein [Vicinamibacteria bacterium]